MKKLLVLGALALSTSLVLGACGKADTTTSSGSKSTSSQTTQTVAKEDPNKLTYTVNGQEKSVAASTESLTQGFDIKATKDFTIVKNQDGDFFKGASTLENASITVTKSDEIGNDDKMSSDLQANTVALGHGATSFKVMDLKNYPDLKNKYDIYKTSVGPVDGPVKQYAFVKTANKKVTIVAIYIPSNKVTPEMDAQVEAIAASVKAQ